VQGLVPQHPKFLQQPFDIQSCQPDKVLESGHVIVEHVYPAQQPFDTQVALALHALQSLGHVSHTGIV
jgi:hypothetical protein